MRIRVQKFLIFSVVVALAVANAFAPRHVQAAAGQHAQVMAAAVHHLHDGAAAMSPCHDDGKSGGKSGGFDGMPNHNCCVASCSAIAFIFSNLAIAHSLPNADFNPQAARPMIPVSQNTDDPPPR